MHESTSSDIPATVSAVALLLFCSELFAAEHVSTIVAMEIVTSECAAAVFSDYVESTIDGGRLSEKVITCRSLCTLDKNGRNMFFTARDNAPMKHLRVSRSLRDGWIGRKTRAALDIPTGRNNAVRHERILQRENVESVAMSIFFPIN